MKKINYNNICLALLSAIISIGIFVLLGILIGHIANCNTAFYPSGDPIYVCTVSNILLFSILNSTLFMGSLFFLSL
jgi:uncharacterized membrane protein